MKGFSRELLVDISGYIYFVQMDRIGPIKIGFTKDVGKRLLSLQTGSPYPLRLLCVFPGNESMERELHACFADIRLEGEWFLPHPFLLSEIEEQARINKKHGFMEPNPEKDFEGMMA